MDKNMTLEKRIAAELYCYQGKMSVFVDDLQGHTVEVGADEEFETASTIKAFILATLYLQAQRGKADLAEEITYEQSQFVDGSGMLRALGVGAKLKVKDTATMMIICSDNVATNMIIDYLGLDTINACIRELGFAHTVLHNPLHFDRYRQLGTTTPRDYAALFARIAKGELVSREASAEMLSILRQQHYNTMLTHDFPQYYLDCEETGAPELIWVASKSGSMNACRNDGGIVHTPYGEYVIVLMNKDFHDIIEYNEHPAMVYGARVSRMILDQVLACEADCPCPETHVLPKNKIGKIKGIITMGITLSPWMMVFLVLMTGFAGFVDSAAGGGGLISLPAYLFAGLPPHYTYATNKFSAACGTTFATANFFKNGAMNLKVGILAAIGSFAGSALGAHIVLLLSDELLRTMMFLILPVAAVVILWQRDLPDQNRDDGTLNLKKILLALGIGLGIGLYDGIVGPGTGTFAIIAFTTLMGFDLRTANGNGKVLNLASNYASLFTYLMNGLVVFHIGIPCAVSNILGNLLGSHFALKKGARFIRPMMLVVLVLLLGKLISDAVL